MTLSAVLLTLLSMLAQAQDAAFEAGLRQEIAARYAPAEPIHSVEVATLTRNNAEVTWSRTVSDLPGDRLLVEGRTIGLSFFSPYRYLYTGEAVVTTYGGRSVEGFDLESAEESTQINRHYYHLNDSVSAARYLGEKSYANLKGHAFLMPKSELVFLFDVSGSWLGSVFLDEDVEAGMLTVFGGVEMMQGVPVPQIARTYSLSGNEAVFISQSVVLATRINPNLNGVFERAEAWTMAQFEAASGYLELDYLGPGHGGAAPPTDESARPLDTEALPDTASPNTGVAPEPPDEDEFILDVLPPPPPSMPDLPSMSEPEVFEIVETMPELIGGYDAAEVVYPERAKEMELEGRVYVEFVVDEYGYVRNPEVLRGVHPLLDEAALSAAYLLDFVPGEQRGERVSVRVVLPITFTLD